LTLGKKTDPELIAFIQEYEDTPEENREVFSHQGLSRKMRGFNVILSPGPVVETLSGRFV
jgi:hypothetical protein